MKVTTLKIECSRIRRFCRICSRRFGIRNISCCHLCSLWRQVCQVCSFLECCEIPRR